VAQMWPGDHPSPKFGRPHLELRARRIPAGLAGRNAAAMLNGDHRGTTYATAGPLSLAGVRGTHASPSPSPPLRA
jgi:hypothetical protein